MYDELEKKRWLEGEWLSDLSVKKFHDILGKFSNSKPRDTLLFINHFENRNTKRIEPVAQDQQHLQIIHTDNHWICIFFDKINIYIYNSIYRNYTTRKEGVMIKALFPFFQKLSFQFPLTQQQSDSYNCAVFAMAFATSIFFMKIQ